MTETLFVVAALLVIFNNREAVRLGVFVLIVVGLGLLLT